MVGGTNSRWESKLSERYNLQEKKKAAHAVQWSKMAITVVRELRRRKQYSGPRESIRQARNLTFYLINKTLGVERHRDDIVVVSNWLHTIGSMGERGEGGEPGDPMPEDDAGNLIHYDKLFGPFLANLIKCQAAGGPGGSRRKLKGAILHLAQVPSPFNLYGTVAYILFAFFMSVDRRRSWRTRSATLCLAFRSSLVRRSIAGTSEAATKAASRWVRCAML